MVYYPFGYVTFHSMENKKVPLISRKAKSLSSDKLDQESGKLYQFLAPSLISTVTLLQINYSVCWHSLIFSSIFYSLVCTIAKY